MPKSKTSPKVKYATSHAAVAESIILEIEETFKLTKKLRKTTLKTVLELLTTSYPPIKAPRSSSGYNKFTTYFSALHKGDGTNAGNKLFGNTSVAWKELTDEERQEWNDKAAEDKKIMMEESGFDELIKEKRPASGYNLFIADFHKNMTQEEREDGELAFTKSAAAWNAMSDEEKKPYRDAADENKPAKPLPTGPVTSYNVFVQEKMPVVKSAHPKWNVKDCMTHIGSKLWGKIKKNKKELSKWVKKANKINEERSKIREAVEEEEEEEEDEDEVDVEVVDKKSKKSKKDKKKEKKDKKKEKKDKKSKKKAKKEVIVESDADSDSDSD